MSNDFVYVYSMKGAMRKLYDTKMILTQTKSSIKSLIERWNSGVDPSLRKLSIKGLVSSLCIGAYFES